MKTRQKVHKIKLEISSFDGSILFGIVTAEPDYKLSLILNNKLEIALKNYDTLAVKSPANKDVFFPRYSYSSESGDYTATLVTNRKGSFYLVNKLKNIDYLLLIQSPFDEPEDPSILKKLREIPSVTAALIIDPHMINDRNMHHIII